MNKKFAKILGTGLVALVGVFTVFVQQASACAVNFGETKMPKALNK
ncbi:hypothetical protein [Gottschalkia acidurici]|nr:hypothetical protein [Gottschalkia acidurici]